MRTRSANPIPATSAQPNSASPSTSTSTRIISLPPEMIARIQFLAQDGESATERQKMRARFELVNKEWYNIVDYFTHVVVTKMSDVTRLTSKLKSSKLRAVLTAKTRAITLNLRELWYAGQARKVCGLLKWLLKTETIVIEDISGRWLDKDDNIGSFFVETLGQLTNLRYLTVRSHGCVTTGTIKWLATKWLKVETIEIGCLDHAYGNVVVNQSTGPFASYEHLESLRLSSLEDWGSLSKVLVGLPNSLTTLSLSVSDAFWRTSGASVVIDQISSIAGSLVEFSLVNIEWVNKEFLIPRGLLDGLVSQLTAVERLSIPAYGLCNLATLLAPLSNLTRLKITGNRASSSECEPDELLILIRTSSSLQSLSAEENVYHVSGRSTWTDHQVAQIEREARLNSVDLVWV